MDRGDGGGAAVDLFQTLIPHPSSLIPDPGSLIPNRESRISGTEAARSFAVAKKLEDLPIYPKAVEFCSVVTALLERPAFGRNRKLREQIDDANDSILSNMSEGFEQPTDRAMKKYLFDAKGSAAEVLIRLGRARRKGCITSNEFLRCKSMGDELSRMLGGWIKYLAQCDWKDRGRHGL